jgi:hypothetical protein
MAPKEAIPRAMRVARFIGVLVVLPMVRNPVYGAALKCQGAHKGESIFQRFGTLERPVREQAVVTHADAQPSEKRMQEDAEAYSRPGGLPEYGDDA